MKTKLTAYLPPFIFFAFILWMIIQADMDQKNIMMDIGHSVPYGDKIGHFLLFGILALLINITMRFRQITIRTRRFHMGSVLVFAFAICEEFSQLGFSTRTFDLVDMLSDLIGIGLLSSVAFRRFLVNRVNAFAGYLSESLSVE